MKHLLTGVAMAAALAIAAPVWAQTPGGNNPTSGSAGPLAPKPAPAPAAPAKPMAMPMTAKKPMAAKKPMHHMAAHHMAMHHMAMHHKMSAGDQMTEQLNAQELQRIQSGGAPMAPAGTPGGNNPTSGTAGPFAPAGSAPPPPAKK